MHLLPVVFQPNSQGFLLRSLFRVHNQIPGILKFRCYDFAQLLVFLCQVETLSPSPIQADELQVSKMVARVVSLDEVRCGGQCLIEQVLIQKICSFVLAYSQWTGKGCLDLVLILNAKDGPDDPNLLSLVLGTFPLVMVCDAEQYQRDDNDFFVL